MSTENQNSEAPRWGRPLKKKSRGKAAPSTGDPGFVGPVEENQARREAATIVHSPNVPPPVAAPRRDPDSDDLQLRDLVLHLARGIVDHPDDVSAEIVRLGEDAEFELRVHPDDLGHVIGKQGRTARSLRLALDAAAERRGRHASLEIAD
jgi:hypothetical protein